MKKDGFSITCPIRGICVYVYVCADDIYEKGSLARERCIEQFFSRS